MAALSEYDRLTDAVARKKKSALGDIEDAAGIQVAANTPDPVKNRGAYIDSQVDAAVNSPKPAAPPPAAAPAAAPTDAEQDAAAGIHIPKPVKTAPPKKGLLQRIFGDAGDAAAPAAATAAGLASTAVVPYNPVVGQAPGVPNGPAPSTFSRVPLGGSSPEAAAYRGTQAGIDAGLDASKAAQAARAAAATGAPAVEAAAPAAEAAAAKAAPGALARLGGVIGGAAGAVGNGIKLALNPGVGAALYSPSANPTTDLEKQLYAKYGTDASKVTPEQAATLTPTEQQRLGAATAAPSPVAAAAAGPSTADASPAAQAAAAQRERNSAFLTKNGVSAEDQARPPLNVSDDLRGQYVRGARPDQGVNVSLGDYGVDGQQIYGRASKPGGRIDTFTGVGNAPEGQGNAPGKNGIDFGFKPGEVEAYKESLNRRSELGDEPRAPGNFTPSQDATKALAAVQDIAAKLKSPNLSRKETRQLQAQLAAHSIELNQVNSNDRAAYAGQHANYEEANRAYRDKAASYDGRAKLGAANAADLLRARTDFLKANNDAAEKLGARKGEQEAKTYARGRDAQSDLLNTVDSAIATLPGLTPDQQKLYGAQARTVAMTKKYQDKDGNDKLFSDLSPKERADHITEIISQVRRQNAPGGFFGGGQPSITGQNDQYTPGSRLDYIAGGLDAAPGEPGALSRLGDVLNPKKGKLLTSNGRYVNESDMTYEEKKAYEAQRAQLGQR